jgi:hypothetical protein
MRGRWWKGAASAAAGVVAAATLNVTAAHADWDALCGAEGSGNHATLMCVGMEFGTTADLYVSLNIGSQATTANKCTLTTWMDLRVIDESAPGPAPSWSSPKQTWDCIESLNRRNTWSYFYDVPNKTVANSARSHGCVRYGWTGSPGAGWENCYTSPWVDRG